MSRYGLRALVEIALLNRTEPGRPRSLRLIAQRQQLPLKYLEHTFQRMRKAGLVKSVQGARGGYCLAGAADAIYLDQVFRILEGDIDLIQSGSCARNSSPLHCFLDATVWQPLNHAAEAYFSGMTLADLLPAERDDR